MEIQSLSEITEPLLNWYRNNKRDFPWRADREPYHVWISEIMLQQTRIEAVMSYYVRFIRELPDLNSLSLVSEEKLLKLWEGLGYYSRARNLKKAAEIIVTKLDGHFPSVYADLLKLPGIGEYTAGAIASICFNEKVTAIDGNVLRVISRLTGSYEDVLLPETKKKTGKILTEVLPDTPGDFNEAIMELGETLCLPNGAPLCSQCPLSFCCTANQKNLTEELPVRIKKTKQKKEEKTVLLLMDESGRIAIEKRPDKGLLSGLYQFPNLDGDVPEEEIKSFLTSWNLEVTKIHFHKEAKHAFSHIDWQMKGYRIDVKLLPDPVSSNHVSIPDLQWVSMEELAGTYPLPTAFQLFLPFM